jgi:hypothetical protein
VSNQHESIAEFAKRLFYNGSDLSPLPLRLLDGNLSCEASFLVKCKEIGHQLHLCNNSYPGRSNRLELLLLSGFVFRKIQKTYTQIDGSRISDETYDLLLDALKEFFEKEVVKFNDRQDNILTLESERVKIIKSFIRMIKNKNTS